LMWRNILIVLPVLVGESCATTAVQGAPACRSYPTTGVKCSSRHK
jgi:hypothetical protein